MTSPFLIFRQTMGELLLGTQGWSYNDWTGNFYPPDLPRNRRLVHYSSVYSSVEIDSTFYAIPRRTTVENWARQVPDDFIFSVKVPKVITHEKVLEDCDSELEMFLNHITLLGKKLGVVLFQFGYGFKPEKRDVLVSFIERLPDGFSFAVEVRNRQWLFDDFFDLLCQNNVALAQIDHPWFPRLPETTADFAYIRWLGDRKKIESDFTHIRFDRSTEYEWWAETIKNTLPNINKLYAYMNNHYAGHSPTSLSQFREIYDQLNQ